MSKLPRSNCRTRASARTRWRASLRLDRSAKVELPPRVLEGTRALRNAAVRVCSDESETSRATYFRARCHRLRKYFYPSDAHVVRRAKSSTLVNPNCFSFPIFNSDMLRKVNLRNDPSYSSEVGRKERRTKTFAQREQREIRNAEMFYKRKPHMNCKLY